MTAVVPPTSPDLADGVPARLSNLVLAICAAFVILVGLVVITAYCLRIFATTSHTTIIVEVLILAVIVLWAGIPLATDDADLIGKTAFYAVMLFAIFHFIAAQTIIAFWVVLAVLVLLVLIEASRRQDDQPAYTTIAQIIALTSLVAFVLRKCTEYFLPTLQAALTEQFELLFQLLRLREAIAAALGFIIFCGTVANVRARFREYTWHEYGTPPSPDDIVACLIHDLAYYIGNFFRIITWTAVTVSREFVAYIITTFFGAHLWEIIVYVLATAGLSALLVSQIIHVQPYLYEVLTNTRPFFAPTSHLLTCYAWLVGAYALAAIELAVLTMIWLPRAASRAARRPAYQNLTVAAAGVVICIWIAGFTASATNFIFHLHAKQFVTPGYFTSIVVVFFVWAIVAKLRSATPPPPPDVDITAKS